jgi:acetylornithine/succinyldiaminopimelate/putrescine aminotransferase
LPIGAILVRQKVAEVMQKGDHGSTFAGGPLVTMWRITWCSRVAEPAFLAEVEAKGQAAARPAGRDQQPAHR